MASEAAVPDYQIYANSMVPLGYGLAIWDPAPHFSPVRIGDVGYIHLGGFQLLFNVTEPLGSRTLGEDVPKDFVSLELGNVITKFRKPGALTSSNIEASSFEGGLSIDKVPMGGVTGQAKFFFESSVSEDAILVTKYETQCQDAQLMKRFKDYILAHHRSWLRFARDKGHDVEGIEKLLLVTGHDSTADFSMLAFSHNNQRRTVEFELGAANIASASASWGRWKYHFPRVHEHSGPRRDGSPAVDETGEVVQDQCVFVRALRIYRRAKFFSPKALQAAAGYHDPGSQPPPEDTNAASVYSIPPESDADDVVSVISDTPGFKDPLDAVADYVFKNSGAEIAVLHDQDVSQSTRILCEFMGAGVPVATFVRLTYDDLVEYVHPEGPEDGVEEASDEHIHFISPVLVVTRNQEEEEFDNGDYPLPSSPIQREASLPWEIPAAPSRDGASSVTRGRVDSAVTLTARRASRSVDDDLTASTMYPDVQAAAVAAGLQNAEFDAQSLSTPGEEQEIHYGEYNLDYIPGPPDSWSLTSWSSGTPSYIQKTRTGESSDPSRLGAAWDATFHRRHSTATVNSDEDPLARQIPTWDLQYTLRKTGWSFKPESTHGRGPHLPSTEIKSQTMQSGTQELWRQAYVGRFQVDKVQVNPGHPLKAPQQRLNVRHISDPYSKGNTFGGPGSVIHKHSRANAFSIFRSHSLPSRSHRQHTRPMHMSISILLANNKVQEQYTSTRTTNRLISHGLLEDVGTMGTSTSYSQTKTKISSTISTRSRPTTPHVPGDESQSEGYVSDQRGQTSSPRAGSAPAESSSSQSSTLPPSAPPMTQKSISNHSSALLSSSIDASKTTRVSGDSTHSQSDASATTDRTPALVSQSVTTVATRSRRSSLDMDHEDSPPRTSHAQAFATIDSSYFEHMLTRIDRRVEKPSSHGLVSVFRRKFLGSAKGNAKSSHSTMPLARLQGSYTPPWLTMAPRSKQEERKHIIQNLNDFFKGVGLLPTARVNHKSSSSKGERPKHPNTTTIFENVPADSLYMLLPLWPGETDPASSETSEDPASYFVPIEGRQYLLVYYVPLDEKADKKLDHKKRARSDTRSIATAPSVTVKDRDRIISLRSFKVIARLVSYADLRETGVRVPAFGLSVTGPLREAMHHLPPPEIREQSLDDIIIGYSLNQEKGVEFFPEYLQKLGLCMPMLNSQPQPTSETNMPEEEDVVLTPIGRAVVEMAWLGCMALTSFGSI